MLVDVYVRGERRVWRVAGFIYTGDEGFVVNIIIGLLDLARAVPEEK